jgi:hypothetical protein
MTATGTDGTGVVDMEPCEASGRLLVLMEYERAAQHPHGVDGAFRALLSLLADLPRESWADPHSWHWDVVSEALKIRDREHRPRR